MKKKNPAKDIKLEFHAADMSSALNPPLFSSGISAGFPSPADDYVENKLDLNRHLIKHPSATFFVRVKGNSMRDAGINDGDILIVDKSLESVNNAVAVCIIESEFTVKRLKKVKNELYLFPANSEYEPIKVTDYNNFKVWGIVTYVIHKI
jgi:DNA polymerase V